LIVGMSSDITIRTLTPHILKCRVSSYLVYYDNFVFRSLISEFTHYSIGAIVLARDANRWMLTTQKKLVLHHQLMIHNLQRGYMRSPFAVHGQSYIILPSAGRQELPPNTSDRYKA